MAQLSGCINIYYEVKKLHIRQYENYNIVLYFNNMNIHHIGEFVTVCGTVGQLTIVTLNIGKS